MSIESGSFEWRLVNFNEASQAAQTLALASQVAGSAAIGARAFDLEWRIGSSNDRSSLRVFVLHRGEERLGLAMFSQRRRPLKFLFGEVSLAQVDFTRYWHLGDPYLDPKLDSDTKLAVCRQLLATCLSPLRARECLFFEGVPLEGPMYGAISAVRNELIALELGEAFEHQFIQMPQSFNEYVSQMGSRSKQSVQYSQRRLVRDMEGAVRCDCFETAESVARFVTDATAVSRKTYQWNLLGLGLRDSEGLRQSLSFAARHGWLRSFILYCRDVPVAFMLGNQHGECYYYDDVGYDPAFAKSSVGSVLQIMVLEHLLGRADKPKYFDFSTGYGEHKGRFGNYSRREGNVLVMSPTLANRVLVGTYRLNDRFAKFTVDMLDRAGIKDRLKQLIRRRSTQKSEP